MVFAKSCIIKKRRGKKKNVKSLKGMWREDGVPQGEGEENFKEGCGGQSNKIMFVFCLVGTLCHFVHTISQSFFYGSGLVFFVPRANSNNKTVVVYPNRPEMYVIKEKKRFAEVQKMK